MKEIIVLGGGFAGVRAVLTLHKLLKEKDAVITLIDTKTFHLFTPSLYEVATSEEPKGNIAIPFREIFPTSINLVTTTVKMINTKEQAVELTNGERKKYDYLIVALGSQPSYFSIPGLSQYSIPLKSLSDAVKIKNEIKSMCCKDGQCNKKVQVVIGGGGFSGTELAAELLTYKDKLARQHQLSKDCLVISVIQGSDRLLKELDTKVSEIATRRVSSPQMQLLFGGHIKEVTKNLVVIDNGKQYPFDILIWTGGVRANDVLERSKFEINKRGQVSVNQFLQVKGYENIFASGDVAEFIDEKTKTPAPGVAQIAEEEGKTVGENVYRLMNNKSLKLYEAKHFGYIVPLRGHFAVAQLMGSIQIVGFPGWILQQLVFLRYLYGILPLFKALKRWNTFEMELLHP